VIFCVCYIIHGISRRKQTTLTIKLNAAKNKKEKEKKEEKEWNAGSNYPYELVI
jgi:hypothetical protein